MLDTRRKPVADFPTGFFASLVGAGAGGITSSSPLTIRCSPPFVFLSAAPTTRLLVVPSAICLLSLPAGLVVVGVEVSTMRGCTGGLGEETAGDPDGTPRSLPARGPGLSRRTPPAMSIAWRFHANHDGIRPLLR